MLAPCIICKGDGPDIDPNTCRLPVTNSDPETVKLPVMVTFPVEVIPPTIIEFVVVAPKSVTRSNVIPVRFAPDP